MSPVVPPRCGRADVRAHLVALVVACLAVACVSGGDYGNTSFQCQDGVTCPAGFDCREGVCIDPERGEPAPPEPTPDPGTAPPSDDLPDSADPPAPGPAAATCGTVAMLVDAFDDGDLDDPRWAYSFADPGTTRREIDGALALSVEADVGNAWAGSLSADAYELRGGRVNVEVLQAGGQFTVLELRDPIGAVVQLQVNEGTLGAHVRGPDGAPTTSARRDYDPALDRWWQLREEDGQFVWETSPDAQSWVELHRQTTPLDAANARVLLATGGGLAVASEARFDNLNPHGDAAQPWCAATAVTDDFDDGLRARLWGRAFAASDCSLVEADGRVSITATGAPNAWCGYATGKRYDLRGSAVSVEVLAALRSSASSTFLKVVPYDRDQAVQFVVEDDFLSISIQDGAWTSIARIPYDPVEHRWWRLRESGDAVVWETSPDGATWKLTAQVPAFLDLSAVVVELGAGTWSTSEPGALGTAEFDNFNVAR